MKRPLSLLLLVGLGVVSLRAQLPPAKPGVPPLPVGALIEKRAPDPAQWVIERVDEAKRPTPAVGASTHPDKTGAAKPPAGSRVTVTKTGPVMLRQNVDDQDRTWNCWCVGVAQVTVWPDKSNVLVQTPNPDPTIPTPNYEDYSKTDFPGFEWVSAENYAGVEKLKGRDCLVFKMSRKGADDDPTVTAYAAYVDLETRLPAALEVGGVVHAYTFLPPPKTILAIPEEVQRALDKIALGKQVSSRRIGRPY